MGIPSLGLRAGPEVQDLDGDIVSREMLGGPVGEHHGSARHGSRCALLVSEEVHHELDLILELKAEPIPSPDTVRQFARAEFMIHPRLPLNRFSASFDRQRACRGEVCEGIVV